MIEIQGQEVKKKNYYNSSKQVVNGLKLDVENVNGCIQSQLNRNMFMVSSDEVAYISGNQIVIYDISTKKQSFISREVTDLAPTAFAFSVKNMKYQFAIASQGGPDSCPYAKVFKDEGNANSRKKEDKKKAPMLEHTHLGMGSIILDMIFLNSGKWLVTLSLDQNQNSVVTIFNISKKQVMTSEVFEFICSKLIATNETHEYVKVISPQKIITLKFDTEDSIFELEHMNMDFLEEGECIIDGAYMTEKDRIGLVTNKNQSILIKEDKYVSRFDMSPIVKKQVMQSQAQQTSLIKNKLTNEQNHIPQFAPTSITGMLQGFGVGFGGVDVILALEVFEDSYFVCRPGHTYTVGHPDIYKMINLSVSDDESYLVVAVQHSSRNIKQIIKNQKEINQIEEEGALQNSNNSSNKDNTMQESRTMSRSKNEILRKAIKTVSTIGGGLKPNFENTPSHLLGKIEIYTLDLQLSEIQNTDAPMDKLFGDGAQKGGIMDVAVSPSMSRILTICEDKSLKWWEYEVKKKQPFKILQKLQFPENPLSADIHPMSLQVAIGCKECLKIYFPQEDEFKLVYAETLKSANKVKYSNSGNFLACANGNSVNIYNPYNFQLIRQFAGVHSGNITNLEWVDEYIQKDVYKPKELSYQDLYLISMCNGGAVFKWNVATGARKYEHYNGNKHVKIMAAIYDQDLDLCLDCCNDGKLKFWTEKGYTQLYELNFYPMYVTCAKLYRSDAQSPQAFEVENKLAIFGTNYGTIRCYNWPIDPKSKKPEYLEVVCHQKAVISLNWTSDNQYLITGGEDGQINIIKVQEVQDGHVIANKFLQFESYFENMKESIDSPAQTELNMYYMNKLCMTSKYAIDIKNENIKELEFRLSNLQSDLDDEKEKQELIKQKLIDTLKSENTITQKELKESSAIELEKCDTKYRELSAKRSQNEFNYVRYKDRLKKLLEESLLSLYKDNDNLKQNKEDLFELIRIEEEDIKEQFKEEIKKQEQINEERLQQITEGWQKRENEQQIDLKKYEEVNLQNQNEQNEYLEKTKNRYEEKLQKAQKESEDLRTSYSKYLKLCEKYKMRKMELEQLINETKTQIKHLEDEQQVFYKKQKAMNLQLSSKEQIINSKENELKEFRNRNKHLKNFQNVYDFKVSSLQEERAPLISHLSTIQKNIKELYKELLDEANSQKQIDEKLEESKENIIELKNQIKQKHDYEQITDRKVDKFKYDIGSMIQHQQFNKWNKCMKEIYVDTFEGKTSIHNLIKRSKIDVDNASSKIKGSEGGETISEELVRQRDFMSKKISTISRLNKQSETDRDEIVVRVQNENTHLIRECNTLREERKSLQEQLGQFENALELITKELTRLAYFEDQRQEENQSDYRTQSGMRYNYDILDIPEQKIQKKITVGKTAFEKYKDDKNINHKSFRKRVGGLSMQLGNPRYVEEEIKNAQNQQNSIISKSQSGLIKNSNQSVINNSASIPTFLHSNSKQSLHGGSAGTNKNPDLLLNSLLRDIESYPKEMRSKNHYYEKLKEKVSSFMHPTQASQDSTLILPQINAHLAKNDKIDKSQEDTMLQNLQNSQITDYSSINVTQKDRI